MMHGRTRRQMIDQMIYEYNEPLVWSLVEKIAENTNKSFIEAADIVIDAWKSSKDIKVQSLVNMRSVQLTEEEVVLN